MALATGQPLSEVRSWDDVDVVTAMQELANQAARQERASRGR